MENALNTQAGEILNLETAHATFAVKPLAAFKDVELEAGQYLVRRIVKSKKGESSEESLSQGCIIEAIDGEGFLQALENNSVLQGAIDWLNTQRGEVAKKLMEQGAKELSRTELSIEAVAKMLEEVEVSEGRVSKDKITAWFAGSIESMLDKAFSEKLGTQWTEQVKTQTLNCYRDSFATLAKRDCPLSEEAKGKLVKVIELAGGADSSSLAKYCYGKLTEKKEEKTIEMLGL